MSRRKSDQPQTPRPVLKGGVKPQMRDCAFQRGDGSVDWPATARDFPTGPAQQRAMDERYGR